MYEYVTDELLEFLNATPTAFHAAANFADRLRKAGFRKLSESEEYHLKPGDKAFVARNGSSLIAFNIPRSPDPAFRVVASHSDSPTLKIKPSPEVKSGGYLRLNAEPYGGGLWYTWMDRPLTLAGRVLGLRDGEICGKLIFPDRDLLLIPSLAIHMDHKANEALSLNPQQHLLPVLGLTDAGRESAGAKPETERSGSEDGGSFAGVKNVKENVEFLNLLSEASGFLAEDILSYDLVLALRQKAVRWGKCGEFISGPRIDNMECAFATLMGFLDARCRDISVICLFDNEEVGSTTRQGAASTFLRDTLIRIANALGMNWAGYLRAVARGFMISTDNAHAVHPGYPEKADPVCRPVPNGGIVLKHHAGQKYTTDAVSAAVFKRICRQNDIPWQEFANRSDMRGGSTLGNISSTQVPFCTVDIGLAQLAMHSCFETAGAYDAPRMAAFTKAFFEEESLGIPEGELAL